MGQSPRVRMTVCCTVVVTGLCGCSVGNSRPPPSIDPTAIELMAIELKDMGPRQKPAKFVVNEPRKFKDLVLLFNRAQATRDHKCGDSGQIILHFKRRPPWIFGILAGHDKRYYEFRVYQGETDGIFHVERDAFAKAMAELGIKDLDPGPLGAEP